MSDKELIKHLSRVSDCSLMILVTHDGSEVKISTDYFVSKELMNGPEHERIQDIGSSIMDLFEGIFSYVDYDEATEEPRKDDETLDSNVIYINKKPPPTKH